jgi:hypothetical protein
MQLIVCDFKGEYADISVVLYYLRCCIFSGHVLEVLIVQTIDLAHVL